MSHSKPKERSLKVQLITGFVVFVIFEIIFNIPAVKDFAVQNVHLTNYDMIMLPVGGLVFYLFWMMMEFFVVGPYLKLHEAREAATTGSSATTEGILQEAKELEEKYEGIIAEARRAAVSEKLDQLEVVKNESTQKVTEAESEAVSISEKSSSDIETKVEQLRQSLEQQVEELAGEVVNKIKAKPNTI